MENNENINEEEELAEALVVLFPGEAAYYCSFYGDPDMHIYPIDKLEWVINKYYGGTDSNNAMKIFNLGLASLDCRKFFSEGPDRDCFFIRNGRMVFSDYKHIFDDAFNEFGTDFITAEVFDWFTKLIRSRAKNDAFNFFYDFKKRVSGMPDSNKDILSKMSVLDVIDMYKRARRMLGRD